MGPGFLAEHVDPLGRATKLSYDGDFRVMSIEQPGGRLWRYGRDRLGRVVRMRTPDGLAVHYLHDPGGNVIQERRPGGRIQRFFDANGRMTKAAFGPDVHHHLLNSAEQEWAAFNRAVTDWELRRNFEQF